MPVSETERSESVFKLKFPVRHLSIADNIIVLDANGHISEQGSFESLRSKDGFVSKVILHPDILDQSSSTRLSEGESATKASTIPRILQGTTANDVADLTRRIGDIAVYKYYLAAIGWKLGWSVTVMSFIYMLAQKFPRTFSVLSLSYRITTEFARQHCG
jgi:hypothetical protein